MPGEGELSGRGKCPTRLGALGLVAEKVERGKEQVSYGLPSVRVNGVVDFAVDSCCSVTTIRRSVAEQLGGRWLKVDAPTSSLEGIGGVVVPVLGYMEVHWTIRDSSGKSRVVDVVAMVVGDSKLPVPGLLGLDVLEAYGGKLSIKEGYLDLDTEEWAARVPLVDLKSRFRNALLARSRRAEVRIEKRMEIPGLTREVFEVDAPFPEGTQLMFEPDASAAPPTLLLGRALTVVRGGKAKVQALNTQGRGVRLKKLVIGRWTPVDSEALEVRDLSDLDHVSPAEVICRLQQLIGAEQWKKNAKTPLPGEEDMRFGDNMSAEQKDMLLMVLRQFPETFADGAFKPGTVEGVVCEVDTGDASPIHIARHRNTPEKDQALREQLQELLQNDIIEPGKGEWGFPTVLVKKADGSFRMCVDFRALNEIMRVDRYPIPLIEETIDHLRGAEWYSVVDALWGFWNVKVAEASRDKLAISTKYGLYRFKRMPFGIASAPGIFQRLMQTTLRGLEWSCCLVYLDDTIIYSRTFGSHLVALVEVLTRFKRSGLRLKSKKCVFGTNEVDYLGFRLTKGGLHTQKRLVEAMEEFPKPRSTKSVLSFLALVGFYRKFIPRFSVVSEPLRRIAKASVQFEWGREQQEAFETLKKAVVSAPVLRLPDVSKRFRVVTDAATSAGIGCVLMQEHEDGLHPVAFASRSLKDAEKNYSATEAELLGVIWALGKFRHYLYGREFDVETDHQPLKWLFRQENPEGRLARWIHKLSEYQFNIKYLRGKDNVVADALSRNPVWFAGITRRVTPSQPSTRNATAEVPLGLEYGEPVSDPLIAIAQDQEPWIGKAKSDGQWKGRRVAVLDGVAVLEDPSGERRTLLPRSLELVAVREAHVALDAGHLGIHKTLERMRSRWVAPRDLAAIVRAVVVTCSTCGSRKSKPTLVVPPMRPVKVGRIFERWALDVAGPFKCGRTGDPRFVLVATEYVSRYAVTEVVPDHTAETVARFVWSRIYHQFGPFRELFTDGAREMVGKEATKLIDALGVTAVHPTPYRPALMGLVERFNRTLKDMLALVVGGDQGDWWKYVPVLTYAYNTSVQASTREAPYRIVFGTEGCSAADLARVATSSWGQMTTEVWNSVREKARAALHRAQEAQKRWYDRRVTRQRSFGERELVWILYPVKKVGKLCHMWRGPYRLIESMQFDNWRAKELSTGRLVLVHVGRLRPFEVGNSTLRGAIAELAELFEHIPLSPAGIQAPWEELPRKLARNRSGRYEAHARVEGKWIPVAELAEKWK